MNLAEGLTIVYVAAIVAAAWERRAPRRRQAALLSVATIAGVVCAPRAPGAVRAWLPHAYLVIAYWIPALLTRGPDEVFERRLSELDARLRRLVPRMRISPVLGQWFEWTYLLCYPLVPAAFVVVWTWSDARAVERLWVAVLIAGFACYGALPWTAARPPRFLVDSSAARGIAIINAHVLHRVSHGLNTFPSGHVAVSGAAALAVASVCPQAGVVFAVIAVSIAAAAVVGRYHYLVDVLIGGAVACAAWGIALLIPLQS